MPKNFCRKRRSGIEISKLSQAVLDEPAIQFVTADFQRGYSAELDSFVEASSGKTGFRAIRKERNETGITSLKYLQLDFWLFH
jgi:hypothetical protein